MKNKSRYSLGSSVMVGCLFCLLIMTAIPLLYADESPNPEVFPPDSVPFGRSYGEWSAAWWQWSLSMPAVKHPLFDTAPCDEGQTGAVWFLGGNVCSDVNPGCTPGQVERSCTVPAGTALFFPIVNTEDSFLEERPVSNAHHPECDPQPTINCLRSVAASLFIDPTTDLLAEIDGHAIPNLKERFRFQSTVFGFTLPEGHLLAAAGEGDNTPDGLVPYAPGAYFPAVDDGVYVMLQPLPVGNHILHIKGRFPQFDFNMDITYHLTVNEQ